MKKILMAAVMSLISAIVTSSAIAEQVYAKPVACVELESLFPLWEREGMYPLMGLGGVVILGDGGTQSAVTVIVANEKGFFAIIEKSSSLSCVLSVGNVIEYNSDKIKEIMEWD